MITVEIPQRTLEEEIDALNALREDGPDEDDDSFGDYESFIIGAMVALAWISRGEVSPAAYALQMKQTFGTKK